MRRPRLARLPRLAPITGERREPGRYTIDGLRASDLEWRVYAALRRLGWADERIDFQVQILGGRLPGGQVLDFVVWTYGQPTVIPVQGDYWHTRSVAQVEEDRVKRAAAERAWGRPVNWVPVYSDDLRTDDDAYRVLLAKVGRG